MARRYLPMLRGSHTRASQDFICARCNADPKCAVCHEGVLPVINQVLEPVLLPRAPELTVAAAIGSSTTTDLAQPPVPGVSQQPAPATATGTSIDVEMADAEAKPESGAAVAVVKSEVDEEEDIRELMFRCLRCTRAFHVSLRPHPINSMSPAYILLPRHSMSTCTSLPDGRARTRTHLISPRTTRPKDGSATIAVRNDELTRLAPPSAAAGRADLCPTLTQCVGLTRSTRSLPGVLCRSMPLRSGRGSPTTRPTCLCLPLGPCVSRRLTSQLVMLQSSRVPRKVVVQGFPPRESLIAVRFSHFALA